MTTPQRHRDEGYVTAFVAILVVALMAVAGLVLDAGLGLSAKAQAMDAAQAAARAGANELDLTDYRDGGTPHIDTSRAETAATRWLRNAGYTGSATATSTTVSVTVEDIYDTQLLSLVGVSQLDITATAEAQIERGAGRPR